MTSGNGKQHLYPIQFPLPRGRALLLDDDEDHLQHFATLLERMAYAVRAFTNYQEAETCLDHEPFDFIVVSPAFEAHILKELTLRYSRYEPEVVLTRCLEMNCCVAAVQLGASEFVDKRLTSAEFEHLVTTHFQPRQRGASARASERLSIGTAGTFGVQEQMSDTLCPRGRGKGDGVGFRTASNA
jgi:DNA-binding NtrC family response regulator